MTHMTFYHEADEVIDTKTTQANNGRAGSQVNSITMCQSNARKDTFLQGFDMFFVRQGSWVLILVINNK